MNFKKPDLIFSIVIFYIIATWVFIYLVDVNNLLGIRDYLVYDIQLNNPFLWHHIYIEGGFTEMFQWVLIGLTALYCGLVAGQEDSKERKSFWFLLGILAVFMVIEDAGNPRHYFRFIFSEYYGVHPIWITGPYYLLLGLIPLYAIVRYGKKI
ncbi:hypothetical protein [Natranaerobius trueperi]|uniref:Uncharacterized protein n=1 Tax=Natranaerobius trueperi TaxID=759412 RepID=A0A226BXK7_9FIRM|nr:hypothetical protein [Natranaerobius trueperi]OWZ83763.1 hypothetical protein CDO51_06625 [Natranaerobius trueperi]